MAAPPVSIIPVLSLGRPGLRPSIAAAVLVGAISLLGLTITGAFAPAGGVSGATDHMTPEPSPSPSARPGISLVGPVASPAAGTIATMSAGPAATPPAQQAVATDDPPDPTDPTEPRVTAKPPRNATPDPEATLPPTPPAPTPPPTPAPTPDPTPVPTPEPTPEPPPACVTVPDMVGMTVQNARAAWTGAGFTGRIDPRNGQNDRIVATQSQSAGACLPATTTVKVSSA